jgi:hypothetical protein
VDGSKSIAEATDEVELLFAEAIAAGSRERSLDTRQALLRETNEAIVAQVRGYHARAPGEPASLRCGVASSERPGRSYPSGQARALR